jgi:hypothetical protein
MRSDSRSVCSQLNIIFMGEPALPLLYPDKRLRAARRDSKTKDILK